MVTALVFFEFRENKMGIYLTKPTSTLLVILTALLSLSIANTNETYAIFITIGLFFCLIGDIALMFMDNSKAFLLGLVAFLIGHVVYGGTFIRFGGYNSSFLVFGAIMIVLGIITFILLYPGLGKMKVPVALYILIISFMVSAAAATLYSDNVPWTTAALAVSGSILFWISDLVLAVNRFRLPLKYDRLSLFAYYGGQYLIAVSTFYFIVA